MGVTKLEMERQRIERIGEIRYNKFGTQLKIVEYNYEKDIKVQFNNTNYFVKSSYREFRKDKLTCPYDKTICGIGYLGEGRYKTFDTDIKKPTKEYDAWRSMIRRCYDEQHKLDAYKDCTVCEEWHNFQNFAKWYEENYYQVDDISMHVDKDILVKGNKIYSPETCLIVPGLINGLFVNTKNTKGNLPTGVYNRKNRQPIRPFVAQCHTIDLGMQKTIGSFSTPEEAFYAYKEFKEKYIKEIADKYKTQIPEKLYNAMYKYIVEINN